jgi:hypothetical protein
MTGVSLLNIAKNADKGKKKVGGGEWGVGSREWGVGVGSRE